MSKILFILKERQIPYQQETTDTKPFSSGLSNSVKFINDMLNNAGYESKLVEVIDNNAIDKEVTDFDPDYVVIEALWVVPEKFEVLKQLHPFVTWIIRIHSEIPFLANEGIATDWISKYLDYDNVYVAPNSLDLAYNIKDVMCSEKNKDKILYLPNYYNLSDVCYSKNDNDSWLNVGCFGAIRPLKNQLIQAYAAIKYAKMYGKKLKFHINSSRVENGNNILKNIRGLFSNLGDDYQLIEHDWLEHDDFLKLISQMDIGLQVSFSETFNIVTADFVSSGIPVVVSDEIDWLFSYSFAKETDVNDIVKTMRVALRNKSTLSWLNRQKLKLFNNRSRKVWKNTLV